MTTSDDTRKWTKNRSDELAVEQGCFCSEKHGRHACDFVEKYCHQSKGRWAGERLKLIPWQRDFVMRLFGWRREDGTRRFRTAYIEIAKKNGKSTLMSALSLYLLLADGEKGPEIYLCACDRDQASIIFDEASKMIRKSPSLSKRTEVVPSRKVITAGDGKIVANSSDAPKQDGLNASSVFFDELHRQPDRELWDVMEYSSRSREQPIRISITTAGSDDQGIWHEQREFSEQVEAGVIEDLSHLGIVFRAKEEDDIDDPDTWKKANPSMGFTVSEEDFARDLAEAKLLPAKFANFRRLRLNLVTRSEDKFFDMDAWDACDGDWHRSPSDVPCYLGLDLSSRDDLTALVGAWGDFESGFDVGAFFWLPKENIAELERKHGQPYREWAEQGYITLTEGRTVDYEFVEDAIVTRAELIRLRSLLCDPWNASRLAESLKETHGLPVEYIRQGWGSLNEPTKTLGELITAGKVRHQGNPILRWHASNAVVKTDAAGNIKLDKSKRKHKIDGIAGLVNAIAGALGAIGKDDESTSVYDNPNRLQETMIVLPTQPGRRF
jgi:phage terminase large subunit-like protein